jgi:hypothetical protein
MAAGRGGKGGNDVGGYRSWIKREIVDEVGLGETTPDMPLPRAAGRARRFLSRDGSAEVRWIEVPVRTDGHP